MDEKIYLKVYQDRNNIQGRYFVETIENCIKFMSDWVEQCEESGEQLPVLEPVKMTEEEFNKLPDFDRLLKITKNFNISMEAC